MSVLLTALMIGCPRSGSTERGAGIESTLRAFDEAWERRGDDLTVVRAQLDALHARTPDHPDVLWRLARLRYVEGLSAQEYRAALEAFSEARDFGIHCLDRNDAVARQRRTFGISAAMPRVTAEQTPCLIWTAHGWVRWMTAFDAAAAAMDVPRIESSLARASALATKPEQVHLIDWARGLTLAIRSDSAEQELEEAERLLRSVAEASPESVVVRRDLLVYVLGPLGDREAFDRVREEALAITPAREEERVAQRQVRALAPPEGR